MQRLPLLLLELLRLLLWSLCWSQRTVLGLLALCCWVRRLARPCCWARSRAVLHLLLRKARRMAPSRGHRPRRRAELRLLRVASHVAMRRIHRTWPRLLTADCWLWWQRGKRRGEGHLHGRVVSAARRHVAEPVPAAVGRTRRCQSRRTRRRMHRSRCRRPRRRRLGGHDRLLRAGWCWFRRPEHCRSGRHAGWSLRRLLRARRLRRAVLGPAPRREALLPSHGQA